MIATLKTPGTEWQKDSFSKSAVRMLRVLLGALAVATISVQCAVSEGTEQSTSGFESPVPTKETILECFRNCSTEEFRTLYATDAEKTLSKESLLEDLYEIPSGSAAKAIDNLHAVCTNEDIRHLAQFTHDKCDFGSIRLYMISQILSRRKAIDRKFSEQLIYDLTVNYSTSGLYAKCMSGTRQDIVDAISSYLSSYVYRDSFDNSNLIRETYKRLSENSKKCNLGYMDLLQETKFYNQKFKNSSFQTGRAEENRFYQVIEQYYTIDHSIAIAMGTSIGNAVAFPVNDTAPADAETRLGYLVISGKVDANSVLAGPLLYTKANSDFKLTTYVKLVPHAIAALHCQWRLEFDSCDVDDLLEDSIKTYQGIFEMSIKNGLSLTEEQIAQVLTEISNAKHEYYSRYRSAETAEACQDMYFEKAEKLSRHKYSIVRDTKGK